MRVGSRAAGGGRPLSRTFGLRDLTLAEIRRVVAVSGAVYVAAGLGVLAVWATARAGLDHPTPYALCGAVSAVGGAAVIAATRWLPDAAVRWVWPWAVVGHALGAAVGVPVALHLGGLGVTQIGTTTYVLLTVVTAYVVRRWAVVVTVAVALGGYAAVLAASDEVTAPASGFVYLATVLMAASVVVGGLVDALERSRREERRLRAELEQANAGLEDRVAAQVDELERLGRLRRFLAPQVAEAVVSTGSDHFLRPHRREIAVLFCDVRGFTAFAAHVEPEEVMAVLGTYYDAVGEALERAGATVGAFAGDGIMAYLNDPTPCARPAEAVVELAAALRDVTDELTERWRRQGYDLGVGIGVAMGHATLGVVGWAARSDYTPIGTVVNRASRLCDAAAAGQVLIDHRVRVQLDADVGIGELPPATLDGFPDPVPCYELLSTARDGR